MKRRQGLYPLHPRVERGAVATIVALLLGAGVLMGFGALTIDVGNLMWERRQLQNGADAAVLDFARICGTDTTATACANTGTTGASLKDLIGANAKDEVGSVESVCAEKADGTPWQAGTDVCAGGTYTTLTDCPPTSPDFDDFPIVEVKSKTESLGPDSTILPYFLAQTITNSQGSSVSACARAAWGPPAGGSGTVPVTMSQCEWDDASAGGTNYADPPDYVASPGLGYDSAGLTEAQTHEIVLYTHYGDNAEWVDDFPCRHEDTNGKATNGGFSYLTKDGCEVDVTVPEWKQGSDGNATKCEADDVVGEVVLVPIHECDTTSGGEPSGIPPSSSPACNATGGSHPWYYLTGWARFYVSGMAVSGSTDNIYNTPELCAWPARGIAGKGSYRCLRGWFTTGVIDTEDLDPPGGGNDFGVVGIVPAG